MTTTPTPAEPQVIRCPEKLKPGGCQLHNLHCGWPACNEPDDEPEADTGNPEADRIINRLMSSDPDFDDCVAAAKLIRALATPAEIAQPATPEPLCPACGGNDGGVPCAYPEGGQPGCPRDKRLKRATQASAPSVQVVDLDAAKRLRRVCNAVGLGDAVPADDAELWAVAFSVLGMVARKAEALAPKAAEPDDTAWLAPKLAAEDYQRRTPGRWIVHQDFEAGYADGLRRAPAAQQPRLTLTERLQQRCSDWGTYWRAPDAHGVNLTTEQATELLRDALGVEVEIAAAQQPASPEDRAVYSAIAAGYFRDTAKPAYEAAAPELLHACEQAVEWLEGWASAEPYISVLRAAIAKAKAAPLYASPTAQPATSQQPKDMGDACRPGLSVADAPAIPIAALAELERFLDAAAGEGFVLGDVDAADLYVRIFPEQYAAALAQQTGASHE